MIVKAAFVVVIIIIIVFFCFVWYQFFFTPYSMVSWFGFGSIQAYYYNNNLSFDRSLCVCVLYFVLFFFSYFFFLSTFYALHRKKFCFVLLSMRKRVRNKMRFYLHDSSKSEKERERKKIINLE